MSVEMIETPKIRSRARTSASMRGLDTGARVAFNRGYCKLMIDFIGFMHGQVVADMRGKVITNPRLNGHCMVQWEGLSEAHPVHVDNLVLAREVDRQHAGRYLAWIDY